MTQKILVKVMKSKLKILRDLPLVRVVREDGGPVTVQFERHSVSYPSIELL